MIHNCIPAMDSSRPPAEYYQPVHSQHTSTQAVTPHHAQDSQFGAVSALILCRTVNWLRGGCKVRPGVVCVRVNVRCVWVAFVSVTRGVNRVCERGTLRLTRK